MLWAAVKPLLTPLGYLRIRHPLKAWLDWRIPGILAATLTGSLLALPLPVVMVGPGGLITVITGLLQILIGFYVAALAAVATFDRPTMDQPVDGDPMMLTVRRQGPPVEIYLSRRRFLSYLFGYLAWLSLALYFSGALVNLLADNLRTILPPAIQELAEAAFLLVYLLLTLNLLITTMLGLHYLSDRIHR